MVRIRDALYVQIVRVNVQSGDAQALADALQEHLNDWIYKCAGFVSTNLHVSEDGKHMVNYAQWRDKESFEAFQQHERQKELTDTMNRFNADNVEDDHFELVAQHSIEDEFWSKTRI